ncbi:MAG: glycosyltransferase [Lachnospiraceae bacterium]|nr:glycosyltransferase [Lachnospiraceae bacterium]
MKNKISIIIAVYNIESYLRRCLDSVSGQTYQNIEIILVDDGSTDNSGSICDEYAGKDLRVKVIHKENGGLSDAWNYGLNLATGDYIGYVDGDDFIELDMYEKMLNALLEHEAQIAVCRFRRFNEKNAGADIVTKDCAANKSYVFSRGEALELFIKEDQQFVIMPSVWSKLFSREVVYGFSFTVGKTSQDIMYTTAAICQAGRIVYLDAYLYNYDIGRNDSITNQKTTEKRLNAELEPLTKRIDYLENRGLYELSDKAAYYFYRRLLFYYIAFKNEKQRKQARNVATMISEKRTEIKGIYHNPWVQFGDKARIKLFLFCPLLYYFSVKVYEKIVIPLRS